MNDFIKTMYKMVFLIICSFQIVNFAQQIKTNIPKMVLDAELIIKGTVLSTEAKWKNDHRGKHIYTTALIRVDDMLKGSLTSSEITIEVIGGKVEDTVEVVSDSYTFKKDREYFFFLHQESYFTNNSIIKIIKVYNEKVFVDNYELSHDRFEDLLCKIIDNPSIDYKEYLNRYFSIPTEKTSGKSQLPSNKKNKQSIIIPNLSKIVLVMNQSFTRKS